MRPGTKAGAAAVKVWLDELLLRPNMALDGGGDGVGGTMMRSVGPTKYSDECGCTRYDVGGTTPVWYNGCGEYAANGT